MKKNFRSNCPVCSTLDILGDKWSLIIIRDMILGHKKTFKELSNSKEEIVPSILSARLKMLESFELVTKQKLPGNLKENIYLLTESGIELAPIILEVVIWADKNLRKFNDQIPAPELLGLNVEKSLFIQGIQNNYRKMVLETTH
jgi:DNA-binding HxlR family transcriptional regulator